MGKFAEKSKKAMSGSPIFENRTKVKPAEIIARFPNGITVTEFDVIDILNRKTGEMESVPVLAIAEDTGIYFYGGKVLHDLVNEWLDGYETVAACVADFKADGGVKMKLMNKTSKTGSSYTGVEILD